MATGNFLVESQSGYADYFGLSRDFTIPETFGPARRAFRIRARCCGDQEISSSIHGAQASEPLFCQWQDAAGGSLPQTVAPDTEAWLVAQFDPDLDGAVARFEVYEDDEVFDDHMVGAYAMFEGGLAKLRWNVLCDGDGVADNWCEFFFTARVLGGPSKASEQINSNKP